MSKRYDVIILGSGVSGTVLAAILARRDARVLLIDGGTHPRFAVGESTTPQTSILLSALAARFDIPEIDYVADPPRVLRRVGSTCGIKRAFGFVYHRPGQPCQETEAHQFGVIGKDESHWFRQDIDAYMLHTAIHYGADARHGVKVVDIDIAGDGVSVRTADGAEHRARFLVDATGHNSVIAKRYGLRETPTRLKHHSRSLFTHMVDVTPFDDIVDHAPSVPWHQTTLHHVFERGWFWVIPFNNHPGSTNPLISIGLTIDPRMYPKPDTSPEEDFRAFLERFPSVAKQFVRARAVRPWVSTDRLQYSATSCVGERFCLMSHADGFIDPLFSKGLSCTFEVISELVGPLLAALDDDDFDVARFAPVAAVQRRVLDYADRVVNNAFISWSDFDLWNAWIRIWVLANLVVDLKMLRCLSDFRASRDLAALRGQVARPAFSQFESPDFAEFFVAAASQVEGFERGEISAADAAAAVFALAHRFELPMSITRQALEGSSWNVGDLGDPDLAEVLRGLRWAVGNPQCRELVVNGENFYRWRARESDPHLSVAASF